MILFRGEQRIPDATALEQKYLNHQDLKKLIILVPTNRRVRERVRQIIESLPGKISGTLYVETYATLTRKLYERLPDSPEYISQVQGLYLLRKVLKTTEMFFGGEITREIPATLLENLHHAITEYKRYNISHQDLLENLEESELSASMKRKGMDFANAYEGYYALLEEKSLTDDSLASVRLGSLDDEQFGKIFRAVFPDAETLLVSGFTEFANPEIDLFNKIAGSEGMNVTVTLDYFSGNPGLFGGIAKTADQLKTAGFLEAAETEPAGGGKSFGEQLRRRFFSDYDNQTPKNTSFTGSIYKTTPETPLHEVTEAVRLTAQWLDSGRYKPGEICVVVNDISSYASLLRTTFAESGIPLNLTDRYRLGSVPLLNYFSKLFTIEGGDYFHKDLAALISGGVLPTWLTLSEFHEIAGELRVTRGYRSWMDQIARKSSFWEREEKARNRERYIKIAAELKRVLEMIRGWHKEFRVNRTAAEFRKLFSEFISASGFKRKILTAGADAELVIAGFEYFLSELFGALDIYISEEPDTVFPPSHYREMVQTIIRTTRFNLREEPDAQVLVTTPEEIRGLEFKALIVLGLYDGNFPVPYRKKLFFGREIPGDERIHASGQAFLFYQMLLAWKETLVLSSPVRGSRGEFSPSVLLREFENDFELTPLTPSAGGGKFYAPLEAAEYNSRLLYSPGNAVPDIPGEPDLAEKIRLQKLRRNNDTAAKEYAGIIPPEILAAGKLKPRISVSSLESYQKCPQMYYYQYILSLKEHEEPEDGIKAVELGNLLHEVFRRFYEGKNGNEVVPDEDYPVIRQIAEEVFSSINFDTPVTMYDRLKIVGGDNNDTGTLLYEFLENEAREQIFKPVLFEKEFSAEYTLPGSQEHTFVLKGVIDRIEVNKTLGICSVVDYKTGSKIPGATDMKEGRSLQLPLYMSVAGRVLKEAGITGDYEPAEMYIYRIDKRKGEVEKKKIRDKSTSRKNLEKPDHLAAMKEYQSEMMAQNREKILEYAGSIYSGKFTLLKDYKPSAAPCSYCAFHDICRVREREEVPEE
ncbi:MAG: PD-(D/E)XK nuclease family protein [Ignavibacteriales bacterium]|nr:MAG: PD-(D/E)XK nuclease family protein [Ignavibacteriales bacterium]